VCIAVPATCPTPTNQGGAAGPVDLSAAATVAQPVAGLARLGLSTG
jgi:hypothetical protein